MALQSVRQLIKERKKASRLGEGINLGMLLALFIFILVGIVLLPIITSEVSDLTGGTSPSVTGTDATLLSLVPLFYVLVLVIVPAVVAYRLYKAD